MPLQSEQRSFPVPAHLPWHARTTLVCGTSTRFSLPLNSLSGCTSTAQGAGGAPCAPSDPGGGTTCRPTGSYGSQVHAVSRSSVNVSTW